jgi:hypothetical protein
MGGLDIVFFLVCAGGVDNLVEVADPNPVTLISATGFDPANVLEPPLLYAVLNLPKFPQLSLCKVKLVTKFLNDVLKSSR